MSALLHKLHAAADPTGAAQADAADAALIVTPTPAAGQDLRAKLDQAHRRVAELSIELRALKGETARPDRGCKAVTVAIGAASALVEYEHQRAEAPVLDINSQLCGPGHPEVVTPLRVFLNGCWCAIEDVRAALDEQRLVERFHYNGGWL